MVREFVVIYWYNEQSTRCHQSAAASSNSGFVQVSCWSQRQTPINPALGWTITNLHFVICKFLSQCESDLDWPTAAVSLWCRSYSLPVYIGVLSNWYINCWSSQLLKSLLGRPSWSSADLGFTTDEIWGIPSPTNRGPKNHLSSTTSQLNGNFNGLYLRNETRYKQMCWQLEMSWILVLKRHKTRLHFHPPFENLHFASLPGFADADQQMELNQTLPNVGQ